MRTKSISLLQAQQEFLNVVRVNKNSETEDRLLYLEAYLVNFYSNYIQSEYSRKRLFERDTESGENKILIDSIIDKEKNQSLLSILEEMHRGRNEGDLDLGYFLNRIELLESLIH